MRSSDLKGIYLFVGIEEYNWQLADFLNAASFADGGGINGLFIKVFDGPNEWYGSLGGFDAIAQAIAQKYPNLQLVPYGYLYGNNNGSNVGTEINLTSKYLNRYGIFIADMESEWQNQSTALQQFVSAFTGNTNSLIISSLANITGNNEQAFISGVAKVAADFMPQEYDDTLVQDAISQFPALVGNVPVNPTYDLSQEYGQNDVSNMVIGAFENGATWVSLWEYTYAQQNPALVRMIVEASLNKGTQNMNTQLTSSKEVATFVSGANQFIAGFSVDMCVAIIGALIWHSTAPNSPNNYTIKDVQDMMLQYYALETGDDYNSNGMTLQQELDMYAKMGLTTITLPISATSQHSSDMANVTNALKMGFPVAICGTETGFKYLNGDAVPYAWQPTGNHCIAATGIDSTGNFIVRDCASLVAADNDIPDTPQVYDNSKMDLISGVAIVPSWLTPPAPTPNPTPNPVPPPTGGVPEAEAVARWGALYNELSKNGLNVPVPPTGTGIYNSWVDAWSKQHQFGAVVTHEQPLTTNTGATGVFQVFTGGTCEWVNGVANWYTPQGKITWS